MIPIPFFVFLACLFLTYVLFLLATRGTEAKRERLRRRLEEAILYSSQADDVDVQLARRELLSEIPWLNRALLNVQVAASLKRLIDQADLQITVMRLVLFSLTAGVLAILAASVLSPSYLLMALCGLIAAALPIMYVRHKRKQRLQKFLVLLPNALDLMSRALQAGHAFTEALHMISVEMPEPISTEFRKTYEEQNLGLSLKLALENLTQRIPLLDLRMCVTAILIQRETGGNLAEILEKVAHTIRERFRIMEDLKTLTLSSRWSAWLLCALPIFMALYVSIMNPDYMGVMWRDPRGHKLIFVAALMQIIGMFMVRKIMQVKI